MSGCINYFDGCPCKLCMEADRRRHDSEPQRQLRIKESLSLDSDGGEMEKKP